MGRHAAVDGAAVDPLVAAALAQRATGGPTSRHARIGAEGTPGPVGWPGSTETGGGLGWPGGMGSGDEQRSAEPQPEQPARPRGWCRFFGARAA